MNCIKQNIGIRKFRLQPNDVYEARCGEIFITTKRFLAFHCSCREVFANFAAYREHLVGHYMEQQKRVIIPHSIENSIETSTEEVPIQFEVEIINEGEHEELIVSDDDGVETSEEQASMDENEFVEMIDTLEEEETAPSAKEFDNSSTHSNSVKRLNNTMQDSIDGQHVCKLCGTKFKSRCNLKAHMRRHTGSKDYNCHYCSKQFYTRSELITHERRHKGERPYACQLCEATYVTAGALGEHMKRHTNKRPHKCPQCDKAFFDSYQLKNHFSTHTNEKNFACDKCHSRFRLLKILKTHLKLHDGERQYVCAICGAGFNHKVSLEKHVYKKHHEDRDECSRETFNEEYDKKMADVKKHNSNFSTSKSENV